MDPSFWHDRWENQDIGFHQADIHALLPKYWPRLELASDAPVFVPLCGKSLDMVWLAQQGHRVIGAELSQRAIDDFFAERGLAPTTRASGSFTVKSAGPYELWCGDFFDLPRAAVAGVAGVYDRAALIALPPSLRERYADTLTALLPAQARILLITLEYEQRKCPGRRFRCRAMRFARCSAATIECDELECRDVLDGHPHFKQRGLTALEGVRVSSAAQVSRHKKPPAGAAVRNAAPAGGGRECRLVVAVAVALSADLNPLRALLAPLPDGLLDHVTAHAVAVTRFGRRRGRSHGEGSGKQGHRNKVLHHHLLMFLLAASGPVTSELCASREGTAASGTLRRLSTQKLIAPIRMIAAGTRAVRSQRASADIVLPHGASLPGLTPVYFGSWDCGLTFPAKVRILPTGRIRRPSGEGSRLGEGRTHRIDRALAAWAVCVQPAAAGSAVVFDYEDGHVLYAEDLDAPWYPASLTKMMTAYLALHRHPRQAGDEGDEDLHIAAAQQAAADATRPQDRQGHHPRRGVARAHHALGQRRRRRHRRDARRRRGRVRQADEPDGRATRHGAHPLHQSARPAGRAAGDDGARHGAAVAGAAARLPRRGGALRA